MKVWKTNKQEKERKKTERDESVAGTCTDSEQLENNGGSFQNKNIMYWTRNHCACVEKWLEQRCQGLMFHPRVFEHEWVEYVPVFQNFRDVYLPIPWKKKLHDVRPDSSLSEN